MTPHYRHPLSHELGLTLVHPWKLPFYTEIAIIDISEMNRVKVFPGPARYGKSISSRHSLCFSDIS